MAGTAILGNLVVRLTAEVDSYIQNMRKADTESDRAGKNVQGSTGLINQGFQKLIAAGVVVKAGDMIKDFAVDSIIAAADTSEALAKFGVVFGEFSDQAVEGLQGISDSSGTSVLQLQSLASGIQDTLVPLGFAREEAAGMTVELSQLAVDLAAFNNMTVDETFRKLQSAIVGNTENLLSFGVVAQEAQIKQKALELGLYDGVGAVDAQTKALAIMELAFEGTTDAQGSAARESDSFAAKQRALEGAILELKVALGNEFLPTAVQFLEWTIQGVQNIGIVIESVNALQNAIKTQTETALENNLTWEQYIESLGIAGGAVEVVNFLTRGKIETDLEHAQNMTLARGAVDGWSVSIADSTEIIEDNIEAVEAETVVLPILGGALESVAGEYDAWGSAVELVSSAIKSNTASMIEAERIKLVLKLATEDLTEAEITELLTQQEQLETLSALTDAWSNGELTKYEWIEAVTTGIDTTEEYNDLMGISTETISEFEQELMESRDRLGEVNERIDAAEGLHEVTIDIEVTGDPIPDIPGGGGGGSSGAVFAQHGANFIVPRGYNENFPIFASSDEHVIILTPEQRRLNANTNSPGPGSGKTVHFHGGVHIYGVQDVGTLMDEINDLVELRG